jgi:hypothetical protein
VHLLVVNLHRLKFALYLRHDFHGYRELKEPAPEGVLQVLFWSKISFARDDDMYFLNPGINRD